jgi:hypothetical protein
MGHYKRRTADEVSKVEEDEVAREPNWTMKACDFLQFFSLTRGGCLLKERVRTSSILPVRQQSVVLPVPVSSRPTSSNSPLSQEPTKEPSASPSILPSALLHSIHQLPSRLTSQPSDTLLCGAYRVLSSEPLRKPFQQSVVAAARSRPVHCLVPSRNHAYRSLGAIQQSRLYACRRNFEFHLPSHRVS